MRCGESSHPQWCGACRLTLALLSPLAAPIPIPFHWGRQEAATSRPTHQEGFLLLHWGKPPLQAQEAWHPSPFHCKLNLGSFLALGCVVYCQTGWNSWLHGSEKRETGGVWEMVPKSATQPPLAPRRTAQASKQQSSF